MSLRLLRPSVFRDWIFSINKKQSSSVFFRHFYLSKKFHFPAGKMTPTPGHFRFADAKFFFRYHFCQSKEAFFASYATAKRRKQDGKLIRTFLIRYVFIFIEFFKKKCFCTSNGKAFLDREYSDSQFVPGENISNRRDFILDIMKTLHTE